MSLQIGIIGLGAVGERLMKVFTDRNDCQVIAFCDTSFERLQEMSQRYGVESIFTNYKDLLAMDGLDAVYVAVPPMFHEEVVMSAINANIHILCEKPLANSVEEALRMATAVKGTNIVTAMHFPLNYQRSFVQYEKLVKENYVGTIRRVSLKMHFPHWPRLWQMSDWVASRQQGGYVLEVGVHYIQAIQRIFGTITHVRSKLQFPKAPTKCENSIIAEMKLEDGTLVYIDGISDISGEEIIQFTTYGTTGTIILQNWRELYVGKNGNPLTEITEFDVRANHLIDQFILAIAGKSAEIYDFEIGYQAQVVLEALRHPKNDEWQELKY